MSIQGSNNMSRAIKPLWKTIFAGIFLCVFQFAVQASEVQIQNLDFTRLSGGRLQLQLELDGPAPAPRVFHTDNPARIALDFSGVKSGLSKKKFPINLDAADSVYVAESGGRLRVVINLISSVPYETSTEGNKVFVTLAGAAQAEAPVVRSETSIVATAAQQARSDVMAQFLPEQGIKGLDFRRGPRGEGRILISLSEPNTMVNTREIGGKVEIYFVNTRLPERLSKRYDVSEFATPVSSFDAVSSRQETKITVDLQSPLYEYSQFQSEGMLTVEFRPLTQAEKDVIDSQKDRYTGDRLSLNFQDIEIRSVITLLSEFTGQNVVAGDEVTGRITLKLDDVPWDEALDFIMMTKGLEKYQTGNVTLIAPVGKIKEYKEKQRETEVVVAQLEPLRTEYIEINYARAESFRNLLNGLDTGLFGTCGIGQQGTSVGAMQGGAGQANVQSGAGNINLRAAGSRKSVLSDEFLTSKDDEFALLSPRGTAVVDSRTNTLIVRETASRMEEIRKLIAKLDVPVRQVMIEARIVEANVDYDKALGVRWGGNYVNDQWSLYGKDGATALDPKTGERLFPGTKTVGSLKLEDGVAPVPFVDMGVSNSSSGIGIGFLSNHLILDLQLSAMEKTGNGEVISQPKVVTSDKETAKILRGSEIPYQEASSSGATSTSFKEAALSLEVTPQITPDNRIIMDVKVNKDAPDFANALNGVPPINTNEVNAKVLVNDGETIVIGGVFSNTQQKTVDKVPFLGDLPFVGRVFRRDVVAEGKEELLIFLTPRILDGQSIAVSR